MLLTICGPCSASTRLDRQGALFDPLVLASQGWPRGRAFMRSAGTERARMWAKLVPGAASEKKIKEIPFLESIPVLSLPR